MTQLNGFGGTAPASQQDYAHASAYVTLLTGRDPAAAEIDARIIHDSNKGQLAQSRRGTLLQLWPWMTAAQAQGYGVFVNINEMDGLGHKLENVRAIRAHAVDLDGLDARQQIELAGQSSPSPAFAVMTSPGKAHVYWCVLPYEGNAYATSINRRLRQRYNGDRAVVDPSRVLRLPGTSNLKRPSSPHLVTISALSGWGLSHPVAALEAALADVPDMAVERGARHDLGDPSRAAPSLAHVQRALDMADPNDLDRGEWIAITAAMKQAGWTLTNESSLRALWDRWCSQYAKNDLAENEAQWRSITTTTVGWQSLLRRFPALRFNGVAHAGSPSNIVVDQERESDFWATFNADDAAKASAILCTKHIAEMGWAIAHDEFADRTMITARVPWDTSDAVYPREWSDNDTHGCKAALEATFIRPSKETVADSVRFYSLRRKYHPVRHYLTSLQWDGILRLADLASRYLGAEASPYSRLVGVKFMISAVARIMQPGCKADTMLILEGPQGAGKSSALRRLVGDDWFTDQMPDFATKDAEIQLRGKWLIEIAELDRMNRAEVTAVKSYASRQIGTYRPPYGRATISVPRQCIFTGSTNEVEYLRDQTGNRRFWPIACNVINLEAIIGDRDQLWAEAVFRYRAGERWWLTGDEERLAQVEQDGRRERDPWEELIASRLRIYGTMPITVEHVCTSILGIAFEKHNKAINARVANCLKRAGYARRQIRMGDDRVWRYVRA